MLLDFVFHTPYRFARRGEEGGVLDGGGWESPRVLCFLVRAGEEQPRMVDLGEADGLGDAVERYLASIAPGMRGVTAVDPEREDPATELREALWEPLAKELSGVRRLFVVPEGFLSQLP